MGAHTFFADFTPHPSPLPQGERGPEKALFIQGETAIRGPSLGTGIIYNIVTEAGDQVWPVVRRIAYSDVNPEHNMGSMQFAETVAVNRAVNVRLFSNVVDAEKWLEDLRERN